MKMIDLAPGRWTAGVAALLCAVGTAGAQTPIWYEGTGFVEPLEAIGAGGQLAFGDFDGDEQLDLVQWTAGGHVWLYSHYREYYRPFHLAQNLTAFAVTHEGGNDRMWVLSSGQICELVWDPVGQDGDVRSTGISVSGSPRLRAQERGPDSKLIAVRSSAAPLIYDVSAPPVLPAAPALAAVSFNLTAPTTGEVAYLDAALVNWDPLSGDEVAIATHTGVKVLDQSGDSVATLPSTATSPPVPIHALPFYAPHGVFLDVLPGADTWLGRDLLFIHYRTGSTGPGAIAVRNSAHNEDIYVGYLQLKSISWARFTGTEKPQLFLPMGSARGAVIVGQLQTGAHEEPIFAIEFEGSNIVRLAFPEPDEFAESPPPAAPPVTAVADMDHDGDDDVVFADDTSRAFVVTSELEEADDHRVSIGLSAAVFPNPGAGGGLILNGLSLGIPAGIDKIEAEIWWFDDGAASPELHQIGDVQVFDDPGKFGTLQLEPFAAQSGTSVTYLFLFRAFDYEGDPVPPIRVGAWSMADQNALLMDTSNVYPWLPNYDIVEAGGIAVRPKISPGAGTGWH